MREGSRFGMKCGRMRTFALVRTFDRRATGCPEWRRDVRESDSDHPQLSFIISLFPKQVIKSGSHYS